MTKHEIKVANCILDYASTSEIDTDHVARLSAGADNLLVRKVAEFLREEDFIEIIKSGHPLNDKYSLKAKGLKFRENNPNRSYAEYLDEKGMKEKRDEQHKILQIRELEEKLSIMNKEQLLFWARQRGQFWLTLMLAGAAFILSGINFIKRIVF